MNGNHGAGKTGWFKGPFAKRILIKIRLVKRKLMNTRLRVSYRIKKVSVADQRHLYKSNTAEIEDSTFYSHCTFDTMFL